MADRKPVEPGIYLDMTDEEYFGVEALGSTDLEALFLDPETWWWDTHPRSPLCKDNDESDAQRAGKAVHACLLEGQDAYDARFAVKPSKADHPDALETADDMKAALKALGLAQSGAKAVLAERIREADPDAIFFEEVVKEHMAGRDPITQAEEMRLRLTRRMIEADKELQARLRDGLSEVAVFFTDPLTGQLNRAKFDRLTLQGPCDLKTFTRRRTVTPEDGAMFRAADFKWHIQAAHYWDAWDILPSLPVFGGSEDERALIARIQEASQAQKATHFLWLFYPNNGAPSPLPLDLRRNGAITVEGELSLKAAKENFMAWFRVYGRDETWIETAGVREVDDERHSFKFFRRS